MIENKDKTGTVVGVKNRATYRVKSNGEIKGVQKTSVHPLLGECAKDQEERLTRDPLQSARAISALSDTTKQNSGGAWGVAGHNSDNGQGGSSFHKKASTTSVCARLWSWSGYISVEESLQKMANFSTLKP
jgi:hypothetical protein